MTHVVYAALYERPGLIAGWRESEQITVNDRMLRNLMDRSKRRRAIFSMSRCCREPKPMACTCGR